MQLSELVSEYSINTISEKTKITPEILQKLAQEEFGSFRKVQVVGFINIIEREFGVDLSEFKQKANEYFATHDTTVHSSASINIIDGQKASGKQGGFISIILVLLTLGAIGYGAWFFLNKQTPNISSSTSQNTDNNNNKESMFTQAIDSAKDILNDATTKESIEKKSTDNKEENSTKDIQKEDTAKQTEQNNKKFDITTSQADSNNNQEKSVDLTPASNEQNSTDRFAKESNNTQSDNNESNKKEKSITETTQEPTQKEENTTQTLPQEQSRQEESKSTENNQTVNENSDTTISDTKTDEEKTQTQNSATLESAKLILKKAKRVWLGIYNLDTKKRVSTFAKKEYDFDLSKGKLVVVTGHSMFNLVTNSGTKPFGGVKKSYFILSKDEGVKILTKKEYRALTKKRAW